MNIQEIINLFSITKDSLECETCINEGFEICNESNKAICLLESFVDVLNHLKVKILESERK